MNKNLYKKFKDLISLKMGIIDLLEWDEKKVMPIFNGIVDSFKVGDWYIKIDSTSYKDTDLWISCDKWVNNKGEEIVATIEASKRRGNLFRRFWNYITDNQYSVSFTFINSNSQLPDEAFPLIKQLEKKFCEELPNILETLKSNWYRYLKEEGKREFGLDLANSYFLKKNEL